VGEECSLHRSAPLPVFVQNQLHTLAGEVWTDDAKLLPAGCQRQSGLGSNLFMRIKIALFIIVSDRELNMWLSRGLHDAGLCYLHPNFPALMRTKLCPRVRRCCLNLTDGVVFAPLKRSVYLTSAHHPVACQPCLSLPGYDVGTLLQLVLARLLLV